MLHSTVSYRIVLYRIVTYHDIDDVNHAIYFKNFLWVVVVNVTANSFCAEK